MSAIWFLLGLIAAVQIIIMATKAAVWLSARRWPSHGPEWHPSRIVRLARHLGYALRIGYAIVVFLGAYISILGLAWAIVYVALS